MELEKFLRKIYISRFFDTFIPIGVIFTLLFSKSGLSTFQISLLITIWSIVTLALEVPTGMLADKFSRRNLLIIGLFIRAIGFSFWIAGGFINYAIGFILWGIKNCLHSGTLESFVYDELKTYNSEEQYEKVSGKMGGISSIGLMLSAIIGGWLASYSFTPVLIASIVATFISAIAIFSTKPVKAFGSTGETKYFSILKEAIQHIKTTPSLLFIIAFICLTFATYGAVDEYWALIYENLGIGTAAIGLFVSVVYGLFSLAGYTVDYFNKLPIKNIEYHLVWIAGILFLLVGLSRSVILLPFAFLAIYLIKVANIKFEAQLQHHIKSDQRATIFSIKSLIFEFVYMGFVLFFGFIADKTSVMSILPIAGAIILVSVGIFIAVKNRVLPQEIRV